MKKLILLTSLLLSGFGLQGRGCLLGGICVDEAQDKAQFEQCIAEGGEVFGYYLQCKYAAETAKLAEVPPPEI